MKRECITLVTIAEANPYESPSLKGKRLHIKMIELVGYGQCTCVCVCVRIEKRKNTRAFVCVRTYATAPLHSVCFPLELSFS